VGRKVRRVPLDFDWPLDKTWEGFLNPHYEKCAECDGRGDTVDAQWLGVIVQLLMVAGDDGRKGRLHPWLAELCMAPARGPSPRFAELTTGLAGRPTSPFGHDSIDRWSAEKKIAAAAGINLREWGHCQPCSGSGIDPTHQAAYDAWKETEPPTGEGWQVWETVSEGSPITPVFATPEELARWCANTPNSSITDGTSYEQWLAFIHEGWAPSMIGIGGAIVSGVEGIGDLK